MIMQHQNLKRLRAALGEQAYSQQMSAIEASALRAPVLDLIDIDHPAIECAIDYGYLLEDLATASVNIGPCQLKVVVFNVSEPENPNAEHVVMVYVGPTKVSQRVLTTLLPDASATLTAAAVLQNHLFRLGSPELLSQHLQELSDELNADADRLEQQALEKRAHAVKIANLLSQ